VTQTVTETITQTITQTVTKTVTETVTRTITETVTETNTQTATETITDTITETITPTITETATPSVTSTITSSTTPTITQTITETVTPTITETVTPTITKTNTPIIGEGVAQINPTQVAAGVYGNTMVIEYTAGATTWTASPGYGTLKINIPSGWSAPSLNASDPGYFTVNVINGNLESRTRSGNTIIIQVSNLLAYTGKITVTYGASTTGAKSQDGTGIATFIVESATDGDTTYAIENSPGVNVVLPTATPTVTVTSTITPTITPTNTPIIGEGVASINPTVVAAGVYGNTIIIEYTAGPTNWASSPDYGTLKITIPDGWSQPSLNSSDAGYYSVSVTGGTFNGTWKSGMSIFVSVSDLQANTGKITVTYGAGTTGAKSQDTPGTAIFLVESAISGSETHRIEILPSINVFMPTATPTITETLTASPTNTVTKTITETITQTATQTITDTITETVTETITPTITWTSTPDSTPIAPQNFYVEQNSGETKLSWDTASNTDYYKIYVATGASGKFNSFPAGWNILVTVEPTPTTRTSYTYIDSSGNTFTYYLVSAVNGAGESKPGTMGAKVVFYFKFNPADENANRISLPYVSKYVRASDVVSDIEGGTGAGTNTKIDKLLLWNPFNQTSISYGYSTSLNKWIGTNWYVDSGTSSSNAIYMNVKSDFTWVVAGVDKIVNLNFYYNASMPNANKRSIPFTSVYQKASDIVTDIEGGTGAGTNTKINKVMLWNPVNQSYIVYGYSTSLNKWVGNNFTITPGQEINIYLSGNTGSFTWQPKLVLTPVP
jgi:hypothetical protein